MPDGHLIIIDQDVANDTLTVDIGAISTGEVLEMALRPVSLIGDEYPGMNWRDRIVIEDDVIS